MQWEGVRCVSRGLQTVPDAAVGSRGVEGNEAEEEGFKREGRRTMAADGALVAAGEPRPHAQLRQQQLQRRLERSRAGREHVERGVAAPDPLSIPASGRQQLIYRLVVRRIPRHRTHFYCDLGRAAGRSRPARTRRSTVHTTHTRAASAKMSMVWRG
jgi:hypothetical protein